MPMAPLNPPAFSGWILFGIMLNNTMKLAFRKPVDLIDHLVSIVTMGPYCHVGIVYDNMTISSEKKNGVVKHIFEDSAICDFIEIETSKEKEIIEFLENEIGCKYDLFGTLRFVLPFIKQSSDKWFCSELVVTALAKDSRFKGWEAQRFSPNSLYKKIKSLC